LADPGTQELFDDYVEDWKARFEVGRVVEGAILACVECLVLTSQPLRAYYSVDAGRKQIEMRLRSTDAVKRGPDEVTFADLQAGAVVPCVIKRMAAYGCFLRIDKSSVSGLCHKSEVRPLLASVCSGGLRALSYRLPMARRASGRRA
jgi:rRNA biogenesis protein RRP5